ncbi:MAG: hypothetical protein JWL84_5323 [Rhodospirillales bacterium]|nr:hypothetical protein [Rhodospirillales bacterium]
MRVSRNDPGGGSAAGLAANWGGGSAAAGLVATWISLLALLPAIPAAQAADPPARLGAPQRLTPAPRSAKPSEVPPPAPESRGASGGIRVDLLAPLDPNWAGPLTEAQGGFPLDLWRGAPRALVTAVVPRLVATNSPTLQSLTNRLLLSNARAPDDAPASADAGAAADPPGFAALRVDRLVAAGQIEAASALLAVAPTTGDAGPLDRRGVELAFLGNDRSTACDRIDADVRRYQGPWWSRALITCQALAGDQAKASLGLELLSEQNAPKDETFDALVEAVAGGKPRLEHLPDPSPLHLTLLAAAKLPLPDDALTGASPAVLRAWAGAEGAPPAQRLAAGERAAAFGALPLADLRNLYGMTEFTPDERAGAVGRVGADKGARGHALLYVAAQSQTFGPTRAETLQAMLSQARSDGDFVFVSRIAEPLLLDIRPSPDLAWFAPNAARALFAAGRSGEAQSWLAVAAPDAVPDLYIPWRLALGRDGPTWDAKLLAAALAGLRKSDDEAGARRAALALALLGAFDETVSGADWAPLTAQLPLASLDVPGAPIWFELPRAAADKRLGEAVLLALATAGEGDRLTAQPVRLAGAIAALREVGLEPEARAIAVEAALGAGL